MSCAVGAVGAVVEILNVANEIEKFEMFEMESEMILNAARVVASCENEV